MDDYQRFSTKRQSAATRSVAVRTWYVDGNRVLKSRLFVSFCDQGLRHVLLVHKYVGDEAVIDISTARHNADRPVAQ